MTFEEFTGASLPALLRFAVVLTGDRGLAEDVVQEVLARVYQRWAKIGALDAPEPYVRRMVVNEYLSWRRRWGRVVPHADPPCARIRAGPRGHPCRTGRVAYRAGQAATPAAPVLVLRYYAGMSDAEIAEVLGCGAGTVRGLRIPGPRRASR